MTKPAIPRRRWAGPAARAVLPASTTRNSRCPVAPRRKSSTTPPASASVPHTGTKSPDRSGIVSGHFKVRTTLGGHGLLEAVAAPGEAEQADLTVRGLAHDSLSYRGTCLEPA